MMKKLVYGLCFSAAVLLGSCGKKEQEIYFLNFKPEIASLYTDKVAPAFEAAHPEYRLKVVTAASGSY